MAQSPEHGLQTELETPAAVPLQASVATDRFPLVGRPVLGARNAATEILALYLGKIPWEVNGDTGEDVTFRLNRVLKNWPVGGEALDYPAASITQLAAPYEGHNFTPTILEETLNCFQPGTVLWKTAELVVDYQVDFWTNDEPTRQAIEAGLPRAFNLTEVRSGVLLSGLEAYFKRPVRFTLMSHQRFDTSREAYSRERRIRATVRSEIDVVHLRKVVGIQNLQSPLDVR